MGFSRGVAVRNEQEYFLNCIRNALPSPITPEDGISALKVALAARRSCREKKEINI